MKTSSTISLLIAALTLTGVALADRTDTLVSATAQVTHLTLIRLPDGGASLEACGIALKPDGGVGYQGCAPRVELTGTAQTRAVLLLDSAKTRWMQYEGL